LDGHIRIFKPDQEYHVIFVVDHSPSMGNTDPSPNLPKFSQNHNHRLGASLQACFAFIQKIQQQEGDFKCKYSLVRFNDTTNVVFERQTLSSDSFYDKIKSNKPHGRSTKYGQSLKKVKDLIKTNDQTIVIFLSDGEDLGEPSERESQLRALLKRQPVVVHTVHVGTDQKGKDVLNSMARTGNGCFIPVGDSIDTLLSTFELMAARVG